MSETERFRARPLGSMDQRWDADVNSAELIINMRHSTRGAWREANGYVQIDPRIEVGSVGRIYTAHWFAQHNGARNFIVFESDGAAAPGTLSLKYWKYNGSGAVNIDTGRKKIEGPTSGSSYFEWGNWLYILNGYDIPIRWNGTRKVRVGFGSPPPPPSIVLAQPDELAADYTTGTLFNPLGQRGIGEVSAAEDSNWRYGWAITWLNDQGQESPLSKIAFFAGLNKRFVGPGSAGFTSVLVTIEEAPDHVSGIRLYRTINVEGVDGTSEQSFTVFFHSSWGTGGRLEVLDDHPDRELGSAFLRDNVGLFPPARLGAIFKNTLFTDSGIEYPDRLRFSRPGFIEQFPEDNFFTIGGGRLTGFHATKNALVVFKRHSIDLVRGDPASGFFTERLSSNTGTTSHRVLVEVPGIGLLFLTDTGPHILVGALADEGVPTAWQYIGAEIDETWKTRVNILSLENAHAGVNHVDREVWIQVPADGDDRPKLGLVYHYDTGGWSIRSNYPAAAFIESPLDGTFMFGSFADTAHEGLFVYTGVNDLDGDTFTATYRTAWLEWDKHRTVMNFTPYMLAHNRSLDVDLRVDRRIAFIDASDPSVFTTDTEIPPSEQELWGTGVWGAEFRWQEYRPVRVRIDLFNASSRSTQLRIKADRMEILYYDMELAPEGRGTNFKKLSQFQG